LPNYYENQLKSSVRYSRGKLGATVGLVRNGRVYRQRSDVAASATNPLVRGDVYYPPYTTVDFSVEYGLTRWARLFVSGRNVTNAQKTRYRVVEGAPDWSRFQIANNLGFTFTAGVTRWVLILSGEGAMGETRSLCSTTFFACSAFNGRPHEGQHSDIRADPPPTGGRNRMAPPKSGASCDGPRPSIPLGTKEEGGPPTPERSAHCFLLTPYLNR
jgi:hypothetical protein